MNSYQVVSAQRVASMCAVCGRDNPFSFKGHYYNMEGEWLYATLSPLPEHQSFPGRVHGGIGAGIIDELACRVVNAKAEIASDEEPEVWGVTIDLHVRYRKPTPCDEPLYGIAHITKESHRMFDSEVFVYSSDGTLCLEGTGRCLKLAIEDISDYDFGEKDWFDDPEPAPDTVEIPVVPKFLQE